MGDGAGGALSRSTPAAAVCRGGATDARQIAAKGRRNALGQ